MSESTYIGQIKFSRKLGTYQLFIQCDKGDIWQEYDGESSAPTNVTPDFATMKPTLAFIITSSRVAEGTVVPDAVKWYFNDVLLTFGTDNLSTNTLGSETGHFKNVPYAAGTNLYYSLQVVKNLVKASANATCNIRCEATVTIGNASDTVQYTYSIPITKGVGSRKVVSIAAGDNNMFCIREKGGQCILTANAWLGAEEITSGLTYKWYTQQEGTWSLLSGQTSKNLTVTEAMVQTNGIFKAEVSQNGNFIGMDTQTVMDLSDPYDILPNPDPEDETIEEGSGGTVTYTPVLVKRGSTQKAKDMQFYIVFMDVAGVILNTATATTPVASATCTEEMCQQAGGNVTYVISTAE